jgi:hypothetical protein
MGFFGGGNKNDDHYDRVVELQEEQIRTNKAELEAKKQNLYQTRLDIIKGQGAQIWTPNMGSKVPTPNTGGKPRVPLPFGGRSITLPR